MKNLYNANGIIFWSEEEIKLRNMFEGYFKNVVLKSLKEQNQAFQLIQVEAPILTPYKYINQNYTENDIYLFDDMALRPETTMGSYEYAKVLLSGYENIKFKPPIVVYQHGKSFRREQDQPTKFMRLKEFYQLEFQIIFSNSTMKDYSEKLYIDLWKSFNKLIGNCVAEPSDRLPSYSEETIDIINVWDGNSMELCSMSKRKDFEGFKVIEIAIGTDRCIQRFNKDLNSLDI